MLVVLLLSRRRWTEFSPVTWFAAPDRRRESHTSLSHFRHFHWYSILCEVLLFTVWRYSDSIASLFHFLWQQVAQWAESATICLQARLGPMRSTFTHLHANISVTWWFLYIWMNCVVVYFIVYHILPSVRLEKLVLLPVIMIIRAYVRTEDVRAAVRYTRITNIEHHLQQSQVTMLRMITKEYNMRTIKTSCSWI